MKLPLTWTTARGEEIPLRDMTEAHIRNCLALMERNIEYMRFQKISKAYQFQSFLHGDGAIDAVESEISMMEMMDEANFLSTYIPHYKALKLELQRRNQ